MRFCPKGSQLQTSIGLDQQLIAAATSGDAAAFSVLVERHRAELQVHAYRILGSLEDAQDAVQDALLRAWRSRETYDGLSTFRAWLYRITTNACLRILERRPRRLVPYEEGPAAELGARPASPSELPWLQPYPDLLLDEVPQPDDAVVARETIELAFLAAIQHLPPRQRAVLILRDALDWPADDTAAVLEMSLAAVNSALQRARATMQERLPARLEWATALDAEDAERSLLETYVEAFERHDDRRLVALLREDVRIAGFSRRVVRVAPGLELDLGTSEVPDAIVVVEEGEAELECRSGLRRRFGRGSMLPIARLPIAHLRSVGPDPLVLVSVSRASLPDTDEFLRGSGSYIDC
jgi:RNA polymerase sigma-70 factor (ECF subfamily)